MRSMTTINSVNSATPNSSLPDALDTGHLELGPPHAAQPNPSPSLSPNPNPKPTPTPTPTPTLTPTPTPTPNHSCQGSKERMHRVFAGACNAATYARVPELADCQARMGTDCSSVSEP